MDRYSMNFGKKERVLNYACQTYQLSRPNKVGSDTTRLKWGYIFLLTRLGWRADLIHTLM